ncbi:MAG: chemotaxis protein CheB [Dehalococcoidia bacterium]|nr:chemotaxis protein CheB [Dehalococcoidia bacterium]
MGVSENRTTPTESQSSSSKKQLLKTTRALKSPTSSPEKKSGIFPIVGIGASAGGLEAFEKFFSSMPAESGMAFVLIPHLDPSHVSILPDLLQRFTRMKVHLTVDGTKVEPNNVYVTPPNKYLAILNGILQLMQPAVSRASRLPINSFFRTLAQDQKQNAACIILSGTGTDGTLGLREIRSEGGLVIVQDPDSAKYDGMPRSAMATGMADYVLPPEEIPGQLVEYFQHATRGKDSAMISVKGDPSDALQKILILLRTHTGHDFSLYKQHTILRRIERRMNVHQINDIASYVRYLEQSPGEVGVLFSEILIGVTSFFRDSGAFEVLKQKVLPELVESKSGDDPIRIWVPACSSGEEAYSIAITLQECMDDLKREFRAQIFGTDINAGAINAAREGHYSSSISANVSKDRLRRFFTQEDNGYRIKKTIREMLVFAPQNIIHDPPFTKLDMVCCRNLLIYMDTDLQRKILPIIHYSLRPKGVLFLGTAETIGSFTDLFGVVDKQWKIFNRKESILANHAWTQFPAHPRISPAAQGEATLTARRTREMNMPRQLEKILLEDYVPPCVVIDEKGDISYVHGRTGQYLEPAQGKASLNILAMARSGLRTALTTAIRQVASKKEKVTYERLQVEGNGGQQSVHLTVKPITEPEALRGMMMVVFEEAKPPANTRSPKKGSSGHPVNAQVAELETELKQTKEYFRTTIEEVEISNQDLKSANEELQSTNEELETSKEELQSLNEELITVNAELQGRNDELSQASDDMKNLLDSTHIATLFLDTELDIKGFTPAAGNILPLIQTDIGRPISHITSNLQYEHLVENVQHVIKTLAFKETEVATKDGRWYFMRITPYRTVTNVIAGVVITFNDITQQKRNALLAEDAREYAQNIVDTIREPLLVLDTDLRVISAGRSFYRIFQMTPKETDGKCLYDLGDRQWDVPELRQQMEKLIASNAAFEDVRISRDFPHIGQRVMLVNGRQIRQHNNPARLILLAMEDVTKQKQEPTVG